MTETLPDRDESDMGIFPRYDGTTTEVDLVYITRKGNSFYGCVNFPRCRYIRNIPKKP